jgi:uncharacterized protein (TIRG00374 family)
MSRRSLSVLAAASMTVFFMWIAVRNVDFRELATVLRSARWQWLIVMTALTISDICIRALRWRILLSRVVSAPVFVLFQLQAIGLAVNNILFARLGELARAALASREIKIPLPTALASVAVERALDVAALLSLFSLASAALPQLVAWPARQAALLLLAAAVAALIVLIFAERHLEPGGRWEQNLRPWPKLHRLIVQMALGASVLRRPRRAFLIVFLSFCLWINGAVLYWAAARALGLGGLADFVKSVLILSWAGAGAALPAAPGAIGTFEAMVKAIMEKLGATANEAFGYAVFVHMSIYLIVTALGLAMLWRIGLSLVWLKSHLERKS